MHATYDMHYQIDTPAPLTQPPPSTHAPTHDAFMAARHREQHEYARFVHHDEDEGEHKQDSFASLLKSIEAVKSEHVPMEMSVT